MIEVPLQLGADTKLRTKESLIRCRWLNNSIMLKSSKRWGARVLQNQPVHRGDCSMVLRRVWLSSILICAPILAGTVDFAHDVRPIFQKHCVACHGPTLQMGDLRLDRRESMLRSVIVPGKSRESKLLARVAPDGPEGFRMPLTGTPLDDGELKLSTYVATFVGASPGRSNCRLTR
jgi:hypothetical protein